MAILEPILVTGATGNVGREVVRALVARGAAVRAADRHPARIDALFDARVASVALDFLDPTTFDAAAAGCRSLFLLRPPAVSDVKPTLNAFVDRARARGVGHVVFLSVAGAGTNRLVPHHAVEVHLRARGHDWTLLRPGFFAQNFGDAYRRDIVEDARVYVPAGRGRVAFVDVRDVAEVTATIFASPAEHESQAYTLTGAEAVDFRAAAAALTDVLGREIRYKAASLIGYAMHLRGRGMPWAQVGVQTVLHAGLRLGQAEQVDPALSRLLGRRPRSLREYMQDHRTTWA